MAIDSVHKPAASIPGLTLRQAALTVGFAYLLNPAAYAQYSLFPKLLIPENPARTAQNVITHPGILGAAILCYLFCFCTDIIVGWGLYHLLVPVNRALSLLASLFQFIYAAMAFAALLNLVAVFDLVSNPGELKSQTAASFLPVLDAQIQLSLNAFQSGFIFSLAVFGVHLVLIGYLIFRSRYIPRIIGLLLTINGLGWIVNTLSGYIVPHARIPYLTITFYGELVFMLWLLIMGWKIKEPVTLIENPIEEPAR